MCRGISRPGRLSRPEIAILWPQVGEQVCIAGAAPGTGTVELPERRLGKLVEAPLAVGEERAFAGLRVEEMEPVVGSVGFAVPAPERNGCTRTGCTSRTAPTREPAPTPCCRNRGKSSSGMAGG